jgi:hypothetical protein
MSTHAGPKIVEDGLFSLYDAANSSSYPGSGTALKDIIYGNDLTIFGATTFDPGGYFTFATDQATQYLMNTNYPNPSVANTYCVWFRTDRTDSGTIQTVFTNNTESLTNNALFYTSSNTSISWFVKNTQRAFNTPFSMKNTWVNAVRTFDSSTGTSKTYANGIFLGQSFNTASEDPSPTFLIIGQEADSAGGSFSAAQNLDGDFSYLSVYDRVLSDNEVKQNFNALRGRYGI